MATPLTPTREAGSYVIADPYDGVPGVAPVEAGSYVIADPYIFPVARRGFRNIGMSRGSRSIG